MVGSLKMEKEIKISWFFYVVQTQGTRCSWPKSSNYESFWHRWNSNSKDLEALQGGQEGRSREVQTKPHLGPWESDGEANPGK